MTFASKLPLNFWVDAVDYSAYILNRSPTSSNVNRASPIKVLTSQAPDLRDIVTFGSLCTVYRDPKKNSFAHRAQIVIIVGRSNETKGYRVFIRTANGMIVTQHVKNIKTPSDKHSEQLLYDAGPEEETFLIVPVVAKTKGKANQKSWVSASHATRGAAKRAAQDSKHVTNDVPAVMQVNEDDPKTHAGAMRSTKAEGWRKEMLEKILALQNNGV
ncbi:FOG: Transposon-encoded proteins with TYA, reverse transcriptase, integrase domains in various combinations [Plasmopara halstedii]|uniref:FOG: Transposon-encoded proteins with TYA, reverse transcriptase, integrase domains in various combinations n=1 Tax=Plasmopara halstedii TaxID=4781 RepID=A0A0P1B130_PLAHL|nr:FOG: Transposon-encoded proteins with TYA, reverse transcriptase, integrase domains in various combinations [Plasmopara halstedii]CEG47617.1 FOG: Transposon-encoded proteins with TYA, reverse transcriptase, integrase domains in various combinations [Plasmopara halstedii]|eukprot:XP_024583986.1 FOG: Transposon-encoded proteins with TYA, reverse transcriptase, integrase domains in various combinations [Plasmopara halstedii]